MSAPNDVWNTAEGRARALSTDFRQVPDASGVNQALTGWAAPTMWDSIGRGLPISPAQRAAYSGVVPNHQEGLLSKSVDFVQSAVSAGTKEFVGFEPSRDTVRFREAHPGLGLTSQLIGFAAPSFIPYVGAARGTAMAGQMMRGAPLGLGAVSAFGTGKKAIAGAEALTNTYLKGAALESLRWMPLQSARLATSVALAPFGASPTRMLKDLAWETPFIGVFGGALGPEGWLAARKGGAIIGRQDFDETLYSRMLQLSEKLPNKYDVDAPYQNQIQKLEEFINGDIPGITVEGRQELEGMANEVLTRLRHLVDTESPLTSQLKFAEKGASGYGRQSLRTHIGTVIGKRLKPLADETMPTLDNVRATNRIEGLFQAFHSLKSGIRARRLALQSDSVPDGYTGDEWKALAPILGQIFPKFRHSYTQFARELAHDGKEGLNKIRKTVWQNMQQLSDDTYISQEIADPSRGGGLFVIAKRWRPPSSLSQIDTARQAKELATLREAFNVPGAKELAKQYPHPDERWFIFKTHDPTKFEIGVDGLNKAARHNYGRHANQAPMPGLPETQDEAWRLAQKLGRVGEHETFNPKNQKHVSMTNTLMAKAAYAHEAQTLFETQAMVEAIDPGLSGMVLAKGTVNPKTGLMDNRFAFTKFFDELLYGAAPARQELTRQLKGWGYHARSALGPARGEIHRAPRGVAISILVEEAIAKSRARGVEQLNGPFIELAEGANWAGQRVFKGKTHLEEAGLIGHLNRAFKTPEGGKEFHRAWLEILSPDEAAERGFKPEVVAALKEINRVDALNNAELLLTKEAAGLLHKYTPKRFHYMLSRSWVGDFRLPIYEEGLDATTNGKLVGYASGHDPQSTIKEANEIVAFINAKIDNKEIVNIRRYRGKKGKDGTVQAPKEEVAVKLKPYSAEGAIPGHLHSQKHMRTVNQYSPKAEESIDISRRSYKGKAAEDMELASVIPERNQDQMVDHIINTRAELLMADPKRFLEQHGAHGFVGQRKAFSLREARERVSANVVETHKTIVRDSLEATLGPQLHRLQLEDNQVFHRIMTRLNNRLGVATPVNRWIDYAFDQALAPIFGARAASKAVHTLNELTYFATLGAFDMGFAVVNATTPIMTAFPELMMVTRIPSARLQHYYGNGFRYHPDGSVRPMAYLDAMKMARTAWQTLTHPSAGDRAIMDEGLRRNVIGRIFMEQIVGQDSKAAQAMFQGRLADPELGVLGNFKNLMQAPVAMSEEFSRGYSFALGIRIAKDFFNMTDEQTFLFASRFTQRTNYGYASADRAKILTGALGTGYGLFKNWTNNYMLNLGTYTKEAFHGNFAPLMTTMIGSTAVGGVIGAPFFGAVDSLAEMMTDKDLVEWMYELTGGDRSGEGPVPMWAADTVMYGLPSLLGVSLQGRASAPGAELMRDATMMINTIHADRAQAFGGMLNTIGGIVGTGMNPYSSEKLGREFVRAFAPRTLQRWYSIAGESGLSSLRTGNNIMSAPSAGKSALHVLGIAPLEIEKAMDVHNELYEDMNKMRDALAWYGEAGANAFEEADWATVTQIYRQALERQIPIPSLSASIQTRLLKKSHPVSTRQFGLEGYQELRKRGIDPLK